MGTITMGLTNPAAPQNQALIYTGVSATLNVNLKNDTGSIITMTDGENASTLEIFMPLYFLESEVALMEINAISQSGWEFSHNVGNSSLLLSWNAGAGTWAIGASLNFNIATVQSTSQPNSDTVQVNFNNLGGISIPAQDSVTLVLNAPPLPGNADITQVLDVDSDFGSTVYVSSSLNPLTNDLFLNFRNTGTTPLYNGATMWTGTPKVTVSFVYGTTSGSLAPDDKENSSDLGSAWGISGAVYVDQTAGWTAQNPAVTSGANSPTWILRPANDNKEIIGTGDHSNVTFKFGNVISFTPIGATQIYVQLSGFRKDENTLYNDTVFVVGITKRNPPAPGAIGIWSLVDEVNVTSSSQDISVPLMWSMFGVGSVKLSFNVPGVSIPDQKYSYGNAHPALNYDSKSVVFKGLPRSALMNIYCSAYSDDNWGNMLNKVEASVPLNFPPVINSFTITSIPTSPPSSYSFELKWAIEGETSFQIIEDDYSGRPRVLPISKDASSYIVNPISAETLYTLNIYGDASGPALLE